MRKVFLICIYFSFITLTLFAQDIQKAELAGSWYPDSPVLLSETIKNYLDQAELVPFEEEVVALVSPHAGLIYSGETAAYAFKAVQARKIDLVVVVGFSHRMSYEGTAVFDKDGFRTPLGVLYTDKQLLSKITDQDKVFADSKPFAGENSIELLLPFIQIALGNPKVLLLAIGRQSLENSEILGNALYQILKDKSNFLIVASTDMSHYLSQVEAEIIDAETAEAISGMQPEELFSAYHGKNRMCGIGTVVATQICAKKLDVDKVVILKQATSAKASGDKRRVVGYLSAVFLKSNNEKTKIKERGKMNDLLNSQQRKELLNLARNTIDLYIRKGKTLEAKTQDPTLKEVMGVFVTLHKGEQLRGCIGNIIGSKPLYLGVRDMAIASSTQDSRFPAVTVEELDDISIEISALSPLKKITNLDEIVLGTHGVLVKQGFRSGVYLPQVATETGWSKAEFMNSLCAHKAGIAADSWKKPECEIYIFSADVFGE